MGAIAIVTMLGAVAVGLVCWLGHHVHVETLRRRQADRVRAALAGRISVAELRQRCGADNAPRYPTPSRAASDPDLAALDGSIAPVGRAS